MDVRELIEARFRSNISRVSGLIVLHQWHVEGAHEDTPGNLPDLLRAAVVLLHASLEDLFRSILEWKLPLASSESLERIPLAGESRDKDKFTLADLAEFRGHSIDAVIARSVGKYLEHSSFNHPGDLTEVLRKTGIRYKISKDSKVKLGAMMSRRHWIAHRVDCDPSEIVEAGKPQTGLSISPAVVSDWVQAVVEVGESVLAGV